MKEFTKFIDIEDTLLGYIIFSKQKNSKEIIIGELIKSWGNKSKQIFITEIDLSLYKSFLYNLWLIQKQNREKNIKLTLEEYKEMIEDLKCDFPYKNIVYSVLDDEIDDKEFFYEVESYIKKIRIKYNFEILEITPEVEKNSKDIIPYSYILFDDENSSSVKNKRKCHNCEQGYLNLKQGQYWDYFQCRKCKNIKKISDL